MLVEAKQAFYNEETGAVQPWRDIEVTDTVGEGLIGEGLAVEIAEGGGGGDSDFSTAQVKLICNAADEVVVYLAFAQEAMSPFIPNPQTDATIYMYNGDERTVTAILYKGNCLCHFSGASGLSGEGDVTTHNQNADITGDCTITIS